MIRIKIDELQQELNILKNKWTVVSESRVQINARLEGLPRGEERTKFEKERLAISIVLRNISNDMSAMKVDVRRLREAERRGILYHISDLCQY